MSIHRCSELLSCCYSKRGCVAVCLGSPKRKKHDSFPHVSQNNKTAGKLQEKDSNTASEVMKLDFRKKQNHRGRIK